MITKYGTITITQDRVAIDDFAFEGDSWHVDDVIDWAIAKLQELRGDVATRIDVMFPGWIELTP